MGRTSGAARTESQTPGVQWPTVTPADDTDDLLLLSAPRMCVCGHRKVGVLRLVVLSGAGPHVAPVGIQSRWITSHSPTVSVLLGGESGRTLTA
jgi:hypothetical protein